MERYDYEGGRCPCCGKARTEYYVLRLWTCTDCDSWLLGVGHGWEQEDGTARWEGLGRYPLGPIDDVAESAGALVRRATEGDLRQVRDLRSFRDD